MPAKMSTSQKMRYLKYVCLVVFTVGFVWLVWSIWNPYVLVSTETFPFVPLGQRVIRGYAIHSESELRGALVKYGISETGFGKSHGSVRFDSQFVFAIENGTLVEIYPGNSGFDIAAVSPSTNLIFVVVRGPAHPLKVVRYGPN